MIGSHSELVTGAVVLAVLVVIVLALVYGDRTGRTLSDPTVTPPPASSTPTGTKRLASPARSASARSPAALTAPGASLITQVFKPDLKV
jgi:hypothetical protein